MNKVIVINGHLVNIINEHFVIDLEYNYKMIIKQRRVRVVELKW